MRVIVAVALTLTVFGVSLAEETKEDKRTRILKFYKCVSCHEKDIVREDYMKCAELKPQKDLFENATNAVLNTFGPLWDEFVTACFVSLNYTCKNRFMYQLRDPAGYPRKCASMQSIWGRPEEESKISTQDYYAIVLDIHGEDYFPIKEIDYYAVLYIHDPHALVNPLMSGVFLKVGFDYIIRVNVEEKEILPAPFKSNCTDYIKAWRKNGGYGPTTKRECYEHCQLESMMKEQGCVAAKISYPNPYESCEDYTMKVPSKISQRCNLECQDACLLRTYTVKVEDPTEAENSVELFSYIGGYMGMWLGISLVSLFDLAEMLMEVALYPLRKPKKVSKNIVRQY